MTAADAVIGSLDVDEIDGGIVTNGPLNGSLHGPGLTIDNGDLAVTIDVEEIEGLSNPLNEHIDANNYDITSIREVDAQSASVSSEPENPSDAARLSEINDVSNEIEDTRTQLESDIDSIEEQTSGLSSDGSDATFDSLKTREASIGQDTTTEDSLTLEHPETGAQFEFGPDGTFSIDQLYTGGGDSDLHYDRVYRDIWEDETIDANISVNADRDQIIKIDSFRADTSSSLYLRFDGKDSENYSYTAEDAGTGDGVHGSEDTEIPIINNVDDSFPAGGFAGRYEIVNPRSSRPGIIGDGVTRNLEAGEEILKRGTFDDSTYPSEINIYTNNTVEECEIEVLEPVPDASRPTDQWG
ncbi:hypothetical protein [Halostagnicola sp. A-GB9-2]|uniref:hypothetical protein n=1 Tax=Halostagnicola sp. A-GB9-2 TaxID=3048066 RepID=UPI0024BFAAD8|nr:hypothetical protein [Halostagnicola sp. A-GB9-2]MDJ1433578.1 hypothetical protein [Halostagnicola sp. A-GB9-2]